MRADVRRVILAALVLAGVAGCVAACGSASRAQIEKAADEARVKVNQYCDARQKAIEALGTGEAGSAP